MPRPFLRLRFEKVFQQYFDKQSAEWISLMEVYFLLAVHLEEYKECVSIFIKVTGKQGFNYLSEKQKQTWYYCLGYLSFLYKVQNVKELEAIGKESKLKFKTSEFLELKPEFNKSEKGLHISLYTIQILFLVDCILLFLSLHQNIRQQMMFQEMCCKL